MVDKHIPSIKTKRLLLRALDLNDTDPFFKLWNESGIMEFFPGSTAPTREQAEKMILRQQQHWGQYHLGWWALEALAYPGQLIGWCGLQYLDETDETEVAYHLSRAFWNRGYASEAAARCLMFGFEELKLDIIIGIVHVQNVASQRVLEKIGLRDKREAEYWGMPSYRYEISRSAWTELIRGPA